MHIGIFVRIGMREDVVENGFGLLRRSAVIQIDQWLAIDLHRQGRKIHTDLGEIVGNGEFRLVTIEFLPDTQT